MLKTFFGDGNISVAKVVTSKMDQGYTLYKVDGIKDRGIKRDFNVGFDESLIVSSPEGSVLLEGPVRTCVLRSQFKENRNCIKQIIFACSACKDLINAVIDSADQIDRTIAYNAKREKFKATHPKKATKRRKIVISHEAMLKRELLLAAKH